MQTKLQKLQEYIGVLKTILDSEETLILTFCNEDQLILPREQCINETLVPMIGKRICVLRTDRDYKSYLIREIDKEKIGSDLAYFIKENCKHCDKKCDVPSVQVFACIFEKLAEKKNEKELKK